MLSLQGAEATEHSLYAVAVCVTEHVHQEPTQPNQWSKAASEPAQEDRDLLMLIQLGKV